MNDQKQRRTGVVVAHDFAGFSSKFGQQADRLYPPVWPRQYAVRPPARGIRIVDHAVLAGENDDANDEESAAKINFLFGRCIRNQLIINRRLIHY